MDILCWTFLTLLSIVVNADPCVQNNLINEKYRSPDYYIDVLNSKHYEHLLCDRTIVPGWYRFTSGGSNSIPASIPTHCVTPFHCGTHAPLWMNGTHPTVADGVVTTQICGGVGSDCCIYKETIRVKNCGSFYVYELKPARGCSIAYCAGTGVPCRPNQWSATGFEPGCKDMYPIMLKSPQLSNPIVRTDTFEFKCHVDFDATRSDVAFDVMWVFGNRTDTSIPATPLTGAQRDAFLDQKYLANHLGESLSCKVRSYFKNTPFRKGPFIPSNGYWCGIKFDKPSVTVSTKDPPQEVKLISTIPIICNKQNQVTCKLELYLDSNNHNTLTTTSCIKVLKPTDWNPITNQAVLPFQILAQRDPKKNPDKTLAMHFQQIFTADGPPIFNGYNIPYLTVHTKDKPTSQCNCWGDPHCQTFDTALLNNGSYYDYYKLGEFTMYESTAPNRLFQVQVRTWSCGSVSCACAVAAREGNDVIIIDMCHGHYGKSFPQVIIPHKGALSQGTVITQSQSGLHYLIDFPSGAQVHVDTGKGRYYNIYVTPPEDDFAATRGLCGTFDGNRDNDLTHKGGLIQDKFPMTGRSQFQPNSFVESWRIPIGSSMFDLKENIPTDPKWNNDIYYCNCDQNKHIVDCTFDNIKNSPAVHTVCPACKVPLVVGGKGNNVAGRKRRATGDLGNDHAPINYFFDYGLSYSPTLRNFPTVNGKTKADAEKACNEAFDKHPTIQQCVTHAGMDFASVKEICVEDFKYFDDGSFIESAIGAAVAACVNTMVRNPSFYDKDGNLPAFISKDRCPSDCSGKGTCVHGVCHCTNGYVGDGCEINARSPPEIYNVISDFENSVLCDVMTRPCETVFVAGDNMYNNSRLSCKMEEFKFDGAGFVTSGKQYTTGVVYNNINNVGCKLPSKQSVGGHTVIAYSMSISNDGHQYSNKVKVVKTDSQCLNCRDTGESCQIQANTCLIDGNCRKPGDINPANRHMKCDPTSNKQAWTPDGGQAVVTLPVAPLGGVEYKRFDIWTSNTTGCPCAHQPALKTCACCDDGGCQCPAPNQQQCTLCGSTKNCGTPQPGPSMGIDGYTLALADCQCAFDTTEYNCACCQSNMNSCQCGPEHRNQCVACDHMNHCGNKPWIFGPPIPIH